MKTEMNEDTFLLLSEGRAVGHHFQVSNIKLYRWLVSLLFFPLLCILPFFIYNSYYLKYLSAWIAAPILGTMWFLRNKKFTSDNFYILLRISLVLLYFFLLGNSLNILDTPTEIRIFMAYFYPFLLIFFRLRPSDSIFIYLFLLIVNLFDFLIPYQPESFFMVVYLIIAYAIFFGIAISMAIMKKKKFLKSWRKEVKKNKDRLRMKLELERAKEIQLEMLPKSLPSSDKLDIAWRSLPATEVGGDYYDSFNLSEQQIALVVGDVSGHGLASGLVLSGTRAGLHLLHDNKTTPVEVLVRLNRMMIKTTDKKTFMTMVYSSFNLSNNIMTFSNAGHTPILHYNSQKGEIIEIRQPSLPLGSRKNAKYKGIDIPFNTDDIFLFYSDGLTEAMNSKNQQYDEIRFLDYFKNLVSEKNHVQEILDSILTDVDIFCEGAEQKDDITLVVVRIK